MHRILVVASNGENILNVKYAPKDMKYKIIKADALIRKFEYDRDHSDRQLWDNKNGMEEWVNVFLKYNVKLEVKYDLSENDSDFEESTESNNNSLKEEFIEYRKKVKRKRYSCILYFNNEELDKILELMPKNKQELENANILSDVKLKLHGDEILKIINK